MKDDSVKIYSSISELKIARKARLQVKKWLMEGMGIAVYVLKTEDHRNGGTVKKYCSFGTPSSAMPDCDRPPTIMPLLSFTVPSAFVHVLIGYIPKGTGLEKDDEDIRTDGKIRE